MLSVGVKRFEPHEPLDMLLAPDEESRWAESDLNIPKRLTLFLLVEDTPVIDFVHAKNAIHQKLRPTGTYWNAASFDVF